jgi:phosphoribosylanthranilate isomerase
LQHQRDAWRGNIVQVAGISGKAEAEMLVECGVDFLGFPLGLDVHNEDISEEGAGEIIRSLLPPHFGVLITYLSTAHDITSLCETLGASIVQLHGQVAPAELVRIREARPGLRILKSIVIHEGEENPTGAIDEMSALVDAFIIDTFDPATGASGATGKTHDWRLSRRIAEYSPRPVILAGGLTPENVGDAIRQVGPAGVDVHTGVENADGDKDRGRVQAFVARAREAFAIV